VGGLMAKLDQPGGQSSLIAHCTTQRSHPDQDSNPSLPHVVVVPCDTGDQCPCVECHQQLNSSSSLSRRGTQSPYRDSSTGHICVVKGCVVKGCVVNGCVVNGCVVKGCVVNGCVVNGCVVKGCVVKGCVVKGCVVKGCVVKGCVVKGCVVKGCVVKGCVGNVTVHSCVVQSSANGAGTNRMTHGGPHGSLDVAILAVGSVSAGIVKCWYGGIVKCWYGGIVKCWYGGIVKCWYGGLVKCWYGGIVKCWYGGIVKCWYGGIVKCWYGGIVKCWYGGIVKCWYGGLVKCWYAAPHLLQVSAGLSSSEKCLEPAIVPGRDARMSIDVSVCELCECE
ncbi:hypothetical protein NFI96_004466, partial [Prochilodus magdalenae]